MLSTLILMGSGIWISMDLKSWYRNLTSFTTSDTATYSAAAVDKTTLFMLLLFHPIGAPQKNTMYPYTLILVSLSLAQSLSLSASNHHIQSFMVGTMCNPKSLVSNTNLATLLSSLSCNLDAPSIPFYNSLTALVVAGFECFVRYNNVPTPDLYKACSFSVTLSSSSTTFCPTKPGVPGVNVLHSVLTS